MEGQDELDGIAREIIVAWLRRNLLDAGGVQKVIGLAHRNNVYKYMDEYPNFPRPRLTFNRCNLWLRRDIEDWNRDRGPRR